MILKKEIKDLILVEKNKAILAKKLKKQRDDRIKILGDELFYSKFEVMPVDSITVKKHYESTAENILFTSDSLFTQNFKDELITILGGLGRDFKKLPPVERKKVVDQLTSLLEMESRWKDLVKSSKYNSTKISSIFPTELRQFKAIFKERFYPPKNSTLRSKSKYGSGLCKNYFEGLFSYIQINIESILNEDGIYLKLSKEDYNLLVLQIDSAFLFKELVKISMKKAYDTNINIKHNNPNNFHKKELDTNFLHAKRTDLQYSLTSYLNLYLANILLNYLSTKNTGYLKVNNTEHIIKSLKYLHSSFKYKKILPFCVTKDAWFGETSKLAMVLLSLFQETDVIKSTYKLNSNKLKKNHIIYVFDHKLDNSISFTHNIPRITPPLKGDTEENIEDWVAQIKEGISNVQVSTEASEALNIAQRKEFVVNTKFTELLKTVDETRESVKEFTTQKEFEKKKEELKAWSESSWGNTLNLILYKITRRAVTLRRVEKQGLHTLVAQLCGMKSVECYANATKNRKRYDLVRMRSSRQLLLTSLDIGDIFQGFPLYYGTRLDFRLRMYPLEYLLSRTSGYLKNILEESVQRRTTAKGFKNMLEAYYSPEPDILKKFKESKARTFGQLSSFFESNLLDISKLPLYFELLQTEITHIQNKKDRKSAIQLEIDQVGSGPTLIALVTKNKVLAEKCNLLGGPFCCIYSYLLEKSVLFIQEKIPDINKSSKAFELVTTNRKAQKYALMCFFYNEQHLNRTKRWLDMYEETYDIAASREEYNFLSDFSVLYEDFMEYVFPNLLRQLQILNDASSILINQDLPIKIETLDKCILSWDFDHSKQLKKNYYNPVSGTHDQYKLNIKVQDPTKSSIRTRNSKHRLSFRPNFIHSIDASIMRMFIHKFYKQTGKKINHLHDCVMIHPNDVDIFYNIVTEVYCNPFMNTLAQDLMFSRMKQDIVGKPLEKMLKLESEFVSNMDDFELKPDTFDPRKCYRYEGAK